MKNKIVLILLFATIGMLSITCKKAEYTFGNITAPTNVTMSVTVQGFDNVNRKGGDSTGIVTLSVSGTNALAYRANFGDSTDSAIQTFTGTTYKYTYRKNGAFNYNITVNAIGTGGALTTVSTNIYIFVSYKLDSTIRKKLTGDNSKVWVIDNNASGNVGVGPILTFSPDYYAANPNERSACLYDDEITFTNDPVAHAIYMTLDNKGESFIINAATSFYGKGTNAGDNCYAIDPGGKKMLQFMEATSASTTDISTRKQFRVPGNGLVAFGTGATNYEILSLTETSMVLRSIGSDGLAWYQKLKVK